jgi:glycosyltransferase involved in cell wall biosynthesis
MKIVLNGKFLRVPSTGVHRVAAELAAALWALKQEDHASVRAMDFEILLPRDGLARARNLSLPYRVVDFMTGIPWEQFTLPFASRRSTVLSLCNIGPVLSRDAITMIHDVQIHLSPQSYSFGFRWWYRLIQPAFARRHRMLLTVSEFSKREIVKIGLAPAGRVAVIPNGVDHVLRFGSDEKIVSRLALQPQKYVLALATTQVHKNIGVLLKAFARMDEQDTKLVLFGGEDRIAFERQGHLVPSNVVFAGRVTDDELKGLMTKALCLAFPSTTEGFGLPPLEAMLLGCPAVVAPCGALPEVCGDAACYVAPDDIEGWIEAIRGLSIDDGVRRNRVDAGIARANSYSWRAAALTLATELRRVEIK